MKLIYCPKCDDVVKMRLGIYSTFCACGASCGRYIDDLNAEYDGDAIPLGIANDSLQSAVRLQPEGLPNIPIYGSRFTAFVIPKQCPTCKKKES